MKEKDIIWGGSLSLEGLSGGGVAGDASKDDNVPLASDCCYLIDYSLVINLFITQ